MLRYRLTHPDILAALAGAGHGSTVLIADGHYPTSTAACPSAAVVPLNLAAGVVSVTEVLAVMLDAVTVEAAAVMAPPDAEPAPAVFAAFGELLPVGMALNILDRFAFYRAARQPDLALLVQTGDVRTYANILLTLGVTASVR